jgi:hypothetical protein
MIFLTETREHFFNARQAFLNRFAMYKLDARIGAQTLF